MKNYVAILAAGNGSRMGLSQPKQFEMLHGKTILEHSVDTFEKHPSINGIFVVVHENLIENTKRLLNVRHRPKIVDVIAGGTERMDSSYSAILAVEHHVTTDCNLLIHDAARPFVTEKIITNTINALKNHSAVSVAIPATDTIYICNDDHKIVSSPKRENVYLAQTPQGARLSVFKQAFTNAHLLSSAPTEPSGEIENFENYFGFQSTTSVTTDDACVILNYLPDEKIHIVLGDPSNRKITFQSDLH